VNASCIIVDWFSKGGNMKNNVRAGLTILSCMLSPTAAGQEPQPQDRLIGGDDEHGNPRQPVPRDDATQQAEMDRAMASMTPEQKAQMAKMRANMEEALKKINKDGN
jgi:hypothetical protein